MKISMVGDVFLGDQLACFGFGVRSRHAETGYKSCFTNVRQLFSDSAVVFANLESPLGLPVAKDQRMRTLPSRGAAEGARALRAGGIHVVSLANNHIFEHGADGLNQTAHYLDAAGVSHTGTTTNPIHIFSHDKMDVAFLSWSLVPDLYWPSVESCNYYHVTNDIEDILEEVKKVRRRVDRIVLGLHWGDEWVSLPHAGQADMAHRLVDAGVDVIAGHHPHVVQPIEIYRGSIIAYSLGNFIFDVWTGEDRHGLVLTVDLKSLTYSVQAIEISSIFAPSPDMDEAVRCSIEAVITDWTPLPEPDAAEVAFRNRRRYRWKLVRHALRNFRHFAAKREIMTLGLRRLFYVLSNLRRERTDPYVVYRGPMK